MKPQEKERAGRQKQQHESENPKTHRIDCRRHRAPSDTLYSANQKKERSGRKNPYTPAKQQINQIRNPGARRTENIGNFLLGCKAGKPGIAAVMRPQD